MDNPNFTYRDGVEQAIKEWGFDGRSFPSPISDEILEHLISPEDFPSWIEVVTHIYKTAYLTWPFENGDLNVEDTRRDIVITLLGIQLYFVKHFNFKAFPLTFRLRSENGRQIFEIDKPFPFFSEDDLKDVEPRLKDVEIRLISVIFSRFKREHLLPLGSLGDSDDLTYDPSILSDFLARVDNDMARILQYIARV